MSNSFYPDCSKEIILIEFTTSEAAQEVAYALRGYWLDHMVILTDLTDSINSDVGNYLDHAALKLLAEQCNSTYKIRFFRPLKLTNTTRIINPYPQTINQENLVSSEQLEEEQNEPDDAQNRINLEPPNKALTTEPTEPDASKTETFPMKAMTSDLTNPELPNILPETELELAKNKQHNLVVNFLFTITEPKFILGTALLAVVTGGVIAAHVVQSRSLV